MVLFQNLNNNIGVKHSLDLFQQQNSENNKITTICLDFTMTLLLSL